MFLGLVLKANRKYTQTIKQSFHLSQAALDVTSADDEPVQLILVSDKTSYILCTLRKKTAEQIPLDLNFAEGEEISFLSKGNGHIHLSGYIVDDDYFGDDGDDFDEDLKESKVKKDKSTPKAKSSTTGNAGEDDDDDDDDDDEEEGDDEDDEDDDGMVEGSELEDSDDAEDEEEDDESDDEKVQEPPAKKEKSEKPKQNGIEKPSKKDKKKEQKQQQQQKGKGEKVLQGGVKIEDIRVGGGPEAKAGRKISVFYEGRLKSNNKIFDSAKQGNAFKFGLGNGEVIKGWDIGILGMKVGGKRRIVCPPNAAYGGKGSPPVIPPNSTLIFDVELKAVH